MTKVYIVIVNYNNYNDTIECLESVLKSAYDNFQIFVVDNSPDDHSMTALQAWVTNDYYKVNTQFDHLVFPLYPKPVAHFVTTEQALGQLQSPVQDKIAFIKANNRGFAAANNVVLSYILKTDRGTPFIWLLNNDTVVEKDSLSKLATYYHNNHGKHILGSKLRFYNKPQTLQAIAGRYNKWIGRHTHIGEGENDLGQYDQYAMAKTDYIVGASLFFTKQFVEEAGLMCEDYFLYFEELDWLINGRKKGFKPALVPGAIIYHKEGAAIIGNKSLDTATYFSITNRVKFIKKFYPWCLPTVLPGVIFALIKRMIKGNLPLVKTASVTIFKILFNPDHKHSVNDR